MPTLGETGLISKAKLWKVGLVGVSPFKVSLPAFVWLVGVKGGGGEGRGAGEEEWGSVAHQGRVFPGSRN